MYFLSVEALIVQKIIPNNNVVQIRNLISNRNILLPISTYIFLSTTFHFLNGTFLTLWGAPLGGVYLSIFVKVVWKFRNLFKMQISNIVPIFTFLNLLPIFYFVCVTFFIFCGAFQLGLPHNIFFTNFS